MNCKVCGTHNEETAHYCAKCGDNLKKQKSTHQHVQPSGRYFSRTSILFKLFGKKALLLTGAVMIAISFVMWLDRKQKQEDAIQSIEQKSIDPTIERKVKDIAALFVCTCGNCSEESLDVCTCNSAVQERQVIRDYVIDGQNRDDIIKTIHSTYGGLKSLFNNHQLKNESQKALWSNRVAPADMNVGALLPGDFNKPATFADRDSIISHFQCFCGKCGKDDLKDCDCSHPKGAGEVKAFIDQKIAEGKYTADQIIDKVDEAYGGRKL